MEALTDSQLENKLRNDAEEARHRQQLTEAPWDTARAPFAEEDRKERDRKFHAANTRRQSKSKHQRVCASAWFSIHGYAASTNRGGK